MMTDRDEIAELLARYAIATDRRDFDTLHATFTPDGIATYGGVRCQGADAIVDHCRPVANFPVTQHVVGSISITVDGDTATATSYTTVHVVRPRGEGGHDVVHRGLSYDDRLVRTPDGWRFSERFHQVLWSTTDDTVWPVRPFGA